VEAAETDVANIWFGKLKEKKISQMVNNDLLHTLLFVIYFMGERLKSCDFLFTKFHKRI
jgi:hypothetical protein